MSRDIIIIVLVSLAGGVADDYSTCARVCDLHTYLGLRGRSCTRTVPLLAQPDVSGNSFGNKGWFVNLGFRKYLRKFAYASQKVAIALDRNKLSVGAHLLTS